MDDKGKIERFNELWFKFLEQTASEATIVSSFKGKKSAKIKTTNISNSIIGAKVEELDYRYDHYYNEKYLKDIGRILEGFNDKNSYQKKRVQKQLLQLASSDGYWRSLTKKSQHELEPFKELFKEPSKQFKFMIFGYLYPDEIDLKPQRSYSNFIPWKIEQFLIGFLRVLIENNNLDNLKPLLDVSSQDISNIIATEIDIKSAYQGEH